jgi:hypothetical protein
LSYTESNFACIYMPYRFRPQVESLLHTINISL